MPTITNALSLDGVRRITLNRPQTRNAFHPDMLRALIAAFREAAQDSHTRVMVLSGAGSHFCAGGDIEWMKSVLDGSSQAKRAHAQAVSDMFQAVYALPQPLVAEVQGSAMGGGIGLVCCADYVIADGKARFALSETQLGIVPAAISPYVVAVLGTRQACRLALAGTVIGVEAAQAIGLVTHVAPEGQIRAMSDAVVQELLRAASGAQRMTKDLLRRMSSQTPDERSAALAVDTLVHAWSHPEAIAGFNAFLEKTNPPWRA